MPSKQRRANAPTAVAGVASGSVASAYNVTAALEKDAVLLQVFAPTGEAWHWFLWAGEGSPFYSLQPPGSNEIPTELVGRIPSELATLYWDAGELFDVAPSGALPSSEV